MSTFSENININQNNSQISLPIQDIYHFSDSLISSSNEIPRPLNDTNSQQSIFYSNCFPITMPMYYLQPYPMPTQNQVQIPGQSLPLQTNFYPISILPNNNLKFHPLPIVPEVSTDKKRKSTSKTFVRRVRQTRPKVVESKGAIQCRGRNRKKGSQCRNAALMEFIGPQPLYCAEHIELDSTSLYTKCKSTYQKEHGDNKGCKEVVLKEFGLCYKHYIDETMRMIRDFDYEKAQYHFKRISELLSQLEREASEAKKKNADLFQRKNKLIPKFIEMKKSITQALEILESQKRKQKLEQTSPEDLFYTELSSDFSSSELSSEFSTPCTTPFSTPLPSPIPCISELSDFTSFELNYGYNFEC